MDQARIYASADTAGKLIGGGGHSIRLSLQSQYLSFNIVADFLKDISRILQGNEQRWRQFTGALLNDNVQKVNIVQRSAPALGKLSCKLSQVLALHAYGDCEIRFRK